MPRQDQHDRLFTAALKEFGEAPSPWTAGWLLPDGAALDFDVGDGTRGTDHRAIEQVYDDLKWTKAMQHFRSIGAVRFHMAAPPRGSRAGQIFVNVSVRMTRAQLRYIEACAPGNDLIMEVTNDHGEQVAKVEERVTYAVQVEDMHQRLWEAAEEES